MTGALAVMASLGGEFINPALAFDFSAPPQLVSASLNGTTQSFLAPSSATNAAFTQAGDWTVEAWYRPTNVTGTHYLFTLGTETANRYGCYLSGTTVTTALYASGSTFVFQNSGFNYSVDGFGGTFPTLTLIRGQLYTFNFTNVSSSHPIALRLSNGGTTAVPGTTGNNTSAGVYGTTVTYQVPLDAPSTIYYQCVFHSSMIGTINIVDSGVSYTSTVPINTWTHVAAVRSGSTVSVYINGTASATTESQAGTIGNGVLRIGADSGGLNRFVGQISNFRVAASAVYTGNFSTPTRPLSLTGAAFFAALGVSPFVDSSTNAIAMTNTGTVTLSDLSPFAATWTDSVSGIVATVATGANFAGNNNATYDPRYGGGLMFVESPRQTYVDVPTSRGVGGGFTISIAAQIPGQPQNHYNAIICGNVTARTGRYVMSRYWQGDGLEFGHIESWVAVNMGSPTSIPLSWYDYVYSANGTTVTLYRNGSQIGTGTVSGTVLGWLNPLRFGGDESITGVSANTMATGVLYRMIHTKTALSAAQVTAQFAAVRATYGL